MVQGGSPGYGEAPARASEPCQESNVQIPPTSLPPETCSSQALQLRTAQECTPGVGGFICQLNPKSPQDWGGSTPRVLNGIQRKEWGFCLHQLELRQALGPMGSGGGMKALLAYMPVQASALQGQVNCGFSH